ncbi:hypothetical protein [Comamonas sp. NLF-1-9]|uniref:DUF7657 domain-containing protein n=1 Tax=Comamonas sp. NLF-1-9 TaxID=2853163 RepID=UPI001C49093D|nr:hypothetical protein [Comamonas sp. NLF-1-9]QXL84443.1 hypothetical protein KUD94_00100 [Comamonas sp. NLF-1-9]
MLHSELGIPLRHWLFMASVLVLLPLPRVARLQHWGDRLEKLSQLHTKRITATIVGIFMLLVAAGITGSSAQLLIESPWNGGSGKTLVFEGQQSHLFSPQPIRSDEWLVLTPNILAQWNHAPKFPVVNENLGVSGQNMGVIGMTGVPIAQLAAAARPATWGFFIFPLRQALSWHWQFALFACLLFLWKALGVLNPQHQGFNLLLATAFCVQPYAAAWSLWPLYVTFLPLAAFTCTAWLLQTRKIFVAAILGSVLGILIAGWVLVLYPPWQVTVGSLMLALAIGWLVDQKKRLRCHAPQWIGAGIAVLLAATLLGSWWFDTSDAVALVRATVYPGSRTVLHGGEIDAPWWTLRGYLNIEALNYGTGPGVNQSEVSSYFFYPIPILFLGLWHCKKSSSHHWVMRACVGFMLFCLAFRFFGIPPWLAKITLWSYVTSTRLDLSFALACTTVMALVYANRRNGYAFSTRQRTWIAWGIAGSSAALAALEFLVLPPGVITSNSIVLQAATTLAAGCGAWWLVRGRMRAAAFLTVILGLGATLTFNPVSRAPRAAHLSSSSTAFASSGTQPTHFFRTLAVGDSVTPSMMLAAAGVPTVGGVLYYPHRRFWKRIGLPESDWPVVNRYQHLFFTLDHLETALPFKVNSAQADVVNVTLDPRRFDFSATGAQRVVAEQKDAVLLRRNPFLNEIGSHGGLFWFEIRADIPIRTKTFN